MLKKQFRLNARTKLQFQRTFKTSYFTLRVSQNGLLYSRFGFVVSKQVDKRAVVRNRVKRIVRAHIEEMFEDIKTGHDMIFILRKEAIETETTKLNEEIKRIFTKEGYLK